MAVAVAVMVVGVALVLVVLVTIRTNPQGVGGVGRLLYVVRGAGIDWCYIVCSHTHDRSRGRRIIKL